MFQDLNENDELVFNSEVPSESNYMDIEQTESYTWYTVYTRPLFSYDAYFQIRLQLLVDKNGEKRFQFGIMAVPLKRTLLDLELNLHVSTRGKSICQEIVRMENHDGTDYETRTYDFFPCKRLKIVLGDVQINKYDKKNYETMDFKIILPREKTYEESGIQSGNYKWYKNISPRKINYKGGI